MAIAALIADPDARVNDALLLALQDTDRKVITTAITELAKRNEPRANDTLLLWASPNFDDHAQMMMNGQTGKELPLPSTRYGR